MDHKEQADLLKSIVVGDTTTAAPAEQKVFQLGDKDEYGWVYGGISKVTGQPMFCDPEDSGVMDWNTAERFANDLRELTGKNIHIAHTRELTQLAQAFKLSSGVPGVTINLSFPHWGSPRRDFHADRFTQDSVAPALKKNACNVRLVCS